MVSLNDLDKDVVKPIGSIPAKSLMNAIVEAGENDTPFPVTDEEGNVAIIGDANKTIRQPHHYVVTCYVDKDKTKYTKEQLQSLDNLVEFKESGAQYLVTLDIAIDSIPIEKRDALINAFSIVMQYMYETVEVDGELTRQLIQDPIKMSVAEAKLANDFDAALTIVNIVAGKALLDLPVGLRKLGINEATAILIKSLTDFSDVTNEVDSNLE